MGIPHLNFIQKAYRRPKVLQQRDVQQFGGKLCWLILHLGILISQLCPCFVWMNKCRGCIFLIYSVCIWIFAGLRRLIYFVCDDKLLRRYIDAIYTFSSYALWLISRDNLLISCFSSKCCRYSSIKRKVRMIEPLICVQELAARSWALLNVPSVTLVEKQKPLEFGIDVVIFWRWFAIFCLLLSRCGVVVQSVESHIRCVQN